MYLKKEYIIITMKEIFGVDELDEYIIDNVEKKKVVLLYFGATWCGPCKQLKKKLAEPETKKDMPKLAVCYIDVDDTSNSTLVNKYDIKSLPTQIFIKLDKNKVVQVSKIEGFDYMKLKTNYEHY